MAFDGRMKSVLKMKVLTGIKGLRYAEGDTVPVDGTAGYAPSCRFGIVTGAGAGNVYINKGTYESCNFESITEIDADDITIKDISTTSLKNVTGEDDDVVTGTAGTDGSTGKWNADGDLVDGKALPTGDIVGTSDTQTLTGKTLTSPKINEDVALTATATQLNKTAVTTAVYSLGTPVLADVDRIVVSTNMKVGEYTVAAQPDVPRNITVSHTTVNTAADTLGTIDIVGTAKGGAVLTETITPVADSTVVGTKAFESITTVTGSGWTIDGTDGVADTITVGVGDKLGLPLTIPAAANIIAAWADSAWVTVDASVGATLSETTIDMSTATYDGSKEMRIFISG